MAKEAIQEVLQAEDRAKEIINQARETARKIGGDLAEENLETEKRIRQEAKDKAQAFYEAVEKEARKEAEPMLAKAREEAEAWKGLLDQDLKKAVDRIKEEVVNYGNR